MVWRLRTRDRRHGELLNISRRGEGSLPTLRGGDLRTGQLSAAPQLTKSVPDLELYPQRVTLGEGGKMRYCSRSRGSLGPQAENLWPLKQKRDRTSSDMAGTTLFNGHFFCIPVPSTALDTKKVLSICLRWTELKSGRPLAGVFEDGSSIFSSRRWHLTSLFHRVTVRSNGSVCVFRELFDKILGATPTQESNASPVANLQGKGMAAVKAGLFLPDGLAPSCVHLLCGSHRPSSSSSNSFPFPTSGIQTTLTDSRDAEGVTSPSSVAPGQPLIG